jgi:N-glycosylase/DNA lyase
MSYYKLTSNGLKIEELDVKHTLESAQPLTFSADFHLTNGTLEYVSGKNLINAQFQGNSKSCGVKFDAQNIKFAQKDFIKRFRLKDDMQDIYSHIATDEFMLSAVEKYRGMRVTLSDPWETTLCFIISQYNNVKRIRLIVKRFMKEFGEDIENDKGKVIAKAFPTSSDLTKFTEMDFRVAGAGFRAKYITKAADYCTNNLDLYKLQNKSYEKVKEELMGISGVGDKVADCISLMGYGKFEAFPIDVWVKRTLEKVYFKGKDKKIKDLHKFAQERWGAYQGQAQQYIFWNGRNL